MSTQARYASIPLPDGFAVCNVANTNYDGTGTIVPLMTAGANGARVDAIGWAAQGTTTAGRLSVFTRKSSADTWRFLFSFEVPALTVSATQPAAGGGYPGLGWILSAGQQIGVAPTKAESFMVHVSQGGNFGAD